VGYPHRIGRRPALTVPPLGLHLMWLVPALPLAAIPHDRRPGWPAAERLEDRVEGSDLATSDDEEAVGPAHAQTFKQESCPLRPRLIAVNTLRYLAHADSPLATTPRGLFLSTWLRSRGHRLADRLLDAAVNNVVR
jgi:hypothetical protein